MKKLILFSTLQLFSIFSYGQQIILPGDKAIDKNFLKPSLTTMGFFLNSNNQLIDIGIYEIEVSTNNLKTTVNSTLYFKDSEKQWKDVCVVNANNLSPISYSSDRDERNFSLSFVSTISGEFINKKNGQKEPIKKLIKEKYFDINFYPHILVALPLKLGYKAIIPVYDFEAADNSKIYNVIVNDVRSDVYKSINTGNHDVWKTSISEESSGNKLEYFIDKQTRRLWQIKIVAKDGQLLLLSDKESDYNPIKQIFNKEVTLKLITNGTSSIVGQVFGRARYDDSSIKIINYNPKQFATKGTAVYLIPYTDWYKEYFKLNKQLKKEGRKFNMPKEALECILISEIYDDKGHFEFANLMPGEYFIYSQFAMYEDHHEHVVVGRSDAYRGNVYQGSSDIMQRNNWRQLDDTFSEEIVKIEKDGDKKEIKLKKQKKSSVY
ncbi:hypothetical protein [Flavobacterium sp.]|uniref:DUF3108 domain-containing protein n=1 Tax=Flavobacterium sp. TaxID=239 RepID=UPI00286D1BE2|nr:hypothetical protein [Flavobacterium sp.]